MIRAFLLFYFLEPFFGLGLAPGFVLHAIVKNVLNINNYLSKVPSILKGVPGIAHSNPLKS
jgi:hypothetical protein